MAKGGGSTRTVSANNNSKGNAEYISTKTKEIEGFKLPGQNGFKYININGENYRIRDNKTSDGRHVVDIIRTSDGYSLGREVFTKSGSYGMATTKTKSQVQKAIREELLRLLNK